MQAPLVLQEHAVLSLLALLVQNYSVYLLCRCESTLAHLKVKVQALLVVEEHAVQADIR